MPRLVDSATFGRGVKPLLPKEGTADAWGLGGLCLMPRGLPRGTLRPTRNAHVVVAAFHSGDQAFANPTARRQASVCPSTGSGS